MFLFSFWKHFNHNLYLCPVIRRVLLFTLVILFLQEPLTLFCQLNTRSQDAVHSHSTESLIIQEFKLLNGLKILMVPTNLDSGIVVNLLIKSGSNKDSIDKLGLAQQTAQHLIFNNQKEQQRVLKALEIKLTVDVLPDSTIFRAVLFPERLKLFLKMLASSLTNPVVKLGMEKSVKNQTSIDDRVPEGLQLPHLYFKRAIFGDHPYGRIPREVKVSPKALYQFLSNHYIPNNASLIVVGSFSPKFLIKEIRENFGPWTKKDLLHFTYPKFPRIDKLSIQLFSDEENSAQSGIVFGHTVPSRSSDDFYSLQALNLILGGFSNGSRLSKAFSTKRINYQFIDSQIEFYELGGLFRVLAKIPSEAATSALTTIIESIENLKQFPVTVSELELAKKHLLALEKARLNSIYSIADKLTMMELFSLSKNPLENFPDELQNLTAGQLQRTAKLYLSTTRAVTIIRGIDERTFKDLNSLGSFEILTIPDLINVP